MVWDSKTIKKTKWSSQQELRRRPLGGTADGGNRMPSSHRESPAVYGNLKKESSNSSYTVSRQFINSSSRKNNTASKVITNNNNNNNKNNASSNSGHTAGGTVLDVNRLNLIKNKCKETGASMNTSTTSIRDIKFSKYIPLPAIKTSRPSLLREKTYDVLEPVYVRGPMNDAVTATSPAENRVKLPEIKNNRIPTSKLRKPPQEILTSASSPRKELLRTPPVNNLTTANLNNNNINNNNNNNNGSIRLKTGKIRKPFNPNEISKASMPESPTVFWFPV